MEKEVILDQKIWDKVLGLNLEPIKKRLKRKQNWQTERVEKAVLSYRRFLYLCAMFPNSQMQPTLDVDEVWHDHILHLKKYMDDCRAICGRIIYHQPFEETDLCQKSVSKKKAKMAVASCMGECEADCAPIVNCESPPTDCALNSTGISQKRSFQELSLAVFGVSLV